MISEENIKKIASLYASDLYEALETLVKYKIQQTKEDRRVKDTIEQTALNIAKQEGAEEFGISLLRDFENYYKKATKK